MYRINDRQEAIREIKKYLYVISTQLYPEIGRTTIDGQFDDATREAVKSFQRIIGLTDNGNVDLETFNALYSAYSTVVDEFYTRDYIIEKTDFPIGIGESGENVRALHILINELAKEHPDVSDVGTGSFYSTRTARSIKALRQIYGLGDGDTVDKLLLSRMQMDLDAMRRRDKNPIETDLIGGRRL